MMRDDWTPTSWRTYPALQQPHYQHTEEVDAVVEILKTYPPLVFSGEVDRLKARLQAASRGQAFILHGGDCAERFVDCNPTAITSKLKILLQMSLILTYGTRKSVIRIGRIAGQYAKPRSQDYEHVNGESLPVFRGDNVNGYGANLDARLARPERLLIGHHKSAMTLNFIRALIDGGFADLHSPENWAITYFANERLRERYTDTIERIKEGISFISAIGASDDETLRTVAFYTSHEGLILPYEEAMTRRVPVRNRFYDLSAHMLWIGDRTRQLDGAHVEFFRGVANPIGLKVGPSASPSEVASLCELLNPSNEAGKIVLITRFGHSEVGALLPAYIRKIAEKGLEVVWEVDPMHANLIKTESGIKTRSFDAVLSELTQSIEIHRNHKSILAGIHFEMTGDDVTECIGGSDGITEEDLTRNYESYCDPRLNYAQSLEMAFLIASMHKPV
jgi:3-deoxy-7-phosphoheptulonate synthase